MNNSTTASIIDRAKGKARTLFQEWRTEREWGELQHQPPIHSKEMAPISKALIIPCDPWTFSGSKGDEAMIQAVIDHLRGANENVSIAAITATEVASRQAAISGLQPIEVWGAPRLSLAMEEISQFGPQAVYALGADVMDGYYSPSTSRKILMLCDLAARRGIESHILGFSFNAHPDKKLKSIYNKTTNNGRLAINLRDPISFERFSTFCDANSNLVADAAFMLNPDYSHPTHQELTAWIAQRKAQNSSPVIGFNVHPMLYKGNDPTKRARLLLACSKALTKLLDSTNVSLVFISHDYRMADGDANCLDPLYQMIEERLRHRIHYPTATLSAAQLKAAASTLDGVVTGRMHLAIGSLGMEVPVAALTYQDKFHGLFKHFCVSSEFLIDPEFAMDSDKLFDFLTNFLNSLIDLKKSLSCKLPDVKALSNKNFTRCEPLTAE